MDTRQLTSQCKPLTAITPTAGAAGTSAINGATIDTLGFMGVLFLLHFGAIVTGAVTSFKLQHGDAANASDMADILGSSQTVADSDDDKVFYAELGIPTKRYCRVVVSRATQNATVAAIALPFASKDAPITQVAAGESVNNPVSGTA